MRKTLRIFISSPGDVQEERLRAHLVVQKLARDYQRFFKIEPYLWEYEPMLASGHFQDAIEPPSKSDIVVLVVYSRLGTPLPERTAAREYRGLDGRVPVTGTEWEFEEALEAHRSRGAPDLVAYRKLGDPQTSLADPERRADQERQWAALEAFWRRHFEGGGVFLAGSSKFRTLEEFDAKLEADLVRIIEEKIAAGLKDVAGAGEEATWLQGSPFQGLAAYDFDDAPIFFGRDAPVRQASTRLQAAAEDGTAFLLILGASGSGKSSLARAGLLPALFAAKAVPGVGVWRRVILRPAEGGDDPVASLAKALLAGDPANGEGLGELGGAGMSADALAAHLAAAPDDPSFPFRQALGRIADEARTRLGLLPHEEARLVLLVDQAEELFTREVDPARRALFVRILAGLARSGIVWVVGTMRNDLWHRAAEIPELVALTEAGARLDLPAPGGAEIIEIVRRPAAAAGIVFEKDGESGVGLDAVMSRAASEEPGALPLLSVMLQSLYERDIVAAGGRALTFASYRELGELKGAIARRADQAVDALRARDPEAADALPRVLRALVTATGEGHATSRPAPLPSFPAGSPERRLVDALLAPENRLLVASERAGVAEVRLAHEALLENWPSARNQIETDRRDLQVRARLETLQRRWAEAGSPAEKKKALLASLNLAEGSDLVRRWAIPRDEGLGAFVAQSESAERWRRGRVAVAALALTLVFAAIAALASLQWRRAEQQSVLARAAEETERQAREAADTARNEAVRERDRADGERATALAALRDAKRSQARTLATQAELSTDRSEIGRALAMAAGAGEIERDLLGPGEAGAAYPAMLKALSRHREILHVRKPKDSPLGFPYDFLGESRIVYADMGAGLMLADLRAGTTARLGSLPEKLLPTRVRTLPAAGVAVVTGIRTLLVVELATGKIRAEFAYPQEKFISALDIDEDSRTAVFAVGDAIGTVDLDNPTQPELIRVPAPDPKINVGQVKFLGGSRTVLVTYGLAILPFDRDARAFGEPLAAELVSERLGRNVSEQVAATGLFPVVHMVPDPASDRLVLFTELEVGAVRADGGRLAFDRDVQDTILGVSRIGSGPLASRSPVGIIGARREDGIDLRLVFLADEPKTFASDTFRAAASDLGNEQLSACTLSPGGGFLACQYAGKTHQGLFVWHVNAGRHPASRIARSSGQASSGAFGDVAGQPTFLSANADVLTLLPAGTRVADVTWDSGWRLGPAVGPFVPAASAGAGRAQVLRVEGPDKARTVLGPLDGTVLAVRDAPARALVGTSDRLALYDLETGKPIWTVPGLSGLKRGALAPDGGLATAFTGEFAYVFDGRTGRIVSSHPAVAVPGSPSDLDGDAGKLAFLAADGPKLLDLASGSVASLGPAGRGTQGVVLALAHGLVLLAGDDKAVVAVTPAGDVRWSVPSPTDGNIEGVTMPGHPPRGTVRGMVVGAGGVLALLRQEVDTLDLHEVATGRFLTGLTASLPRSVPTSAVIDVKGRVLTSWAYHALAFDTPSEVSVHALPLGRVAALAAVTAALESVVPRRPDGTRVPPSSTPSN